MGFIFILLKLFLKIVIKYIYLSEYFEKKILKIFFCNNIFFYIFYV